MDKNPWIAALLSFIYPGLGHLYANKYHLGTLLILITTFYFSVIIYQLIKFGYIITNYIAIFSFIYWTTTPFDAYRNVNESKISGREGKIGINQEDFFSCPQCLYENIKNAENCVNCGKNLKEVLLYSKGSLYNDVEINRRKIIEYETKF